MRYLFAVLALVVAVEYAVIALDVVPRLARLAGTDGRLLGAARWGAGAFFAGCSLTHLGLAVEALRSPSMAGDLGAGRMLVEHVGPHIAQLVGGAVFIVIGKGHLEVSITSKEEAARLRDRERQFRAAFERAPGGIVLVSVAGASAGLVLHVNPALCRMVGYDEGALVGGRYLGLLVHPADREQTTAVWRTLLAGELLTTDLDQRYVHSDGHDVWVNVEASLVRDPGGLPLYGVAQVRDVTEDRRLEGHLRYLAEHDDLTGIFNRRRFEDELDRAVAFVRRYGEPAALLVIDLDHFKYVNDTSGHRAGDELIRKVVSVLGLRLRESDVFGRLGGDEFGVILPRTEPEGAALVAEALLQTIRADAHIVIGEKTVRAAASIGIKMIEADQEVNGEQLLAEADIAMYEAKETGRDRVSMVSGATRMRARLTWSQRIRDALETGGFVLWEQPILNLVTGECDRSELLIRMVDPKDGSLILPAHFLYIAERFGQIQGIDRWVFRQAIDLLEHRQAAGDLRSIEINLSGASLTDEALINELTERLLHSDIDSSRLIVEITETAAVVNVDVARRLARRLSEVGCRFALDDFGSGFGSFFYLKHLHFDAVKIDGEFIKDLPASTTDRLTLKAAVTIALGMGKEVTAEFVQNEETIDLLRDLGVGFAQGYHISQPRPVPELS